MTTVFPLVTQNCRAKSFRIMNLITRRRRRPLLVLACECGGDEEPNDGERHVERGERGEYESQRAPGVDDASLQHIAEPHEERINGSFGLVFGLAAGRQKQRLP